MKFYICLSDITPGELASLGNPSVECVRVKGLGFTRIPKKGEWYIFGTVNPAAYRAEQDLWCPYEMGKLITVEMVEKELKSL